MKEHLIEIAQQFIPLAVSRITPLVSGHIQLTYLVEGQHKGKAERLVLQKINTSIFKRPRQLIENHTTLSAYLSEQKLAPIIPRLRYTASGAGLLEVAGEAWRAQEFIPHTTTFEQVDTAHIAAQGAKIVGQFNRSFLDLDPKRLHTVIPGFHHLDRYLKAYDQALAQGIGERVKHAKQEIKQIGDLAPLMTEKFAATRTLPDRVCHNDTKISNILFDAHTQQAVKVIDLDTVMPEKVIYDFGDMMRSFLSLAGESEQDLSKIQVRDEVFEAMTQGYLNPMKDRLTPEEKQALLDGGLLITFEQAVRFLTDYLRGDTYYQVQYPEQNWVRTKNQLCLLQRMLEKAPAYQSTIERYS